MKKPRKRLGDLQQSEWDTLDEMLVGHRAEVQELLLDRKRDFEEDTEESTPTDDDQQSSLNGNLRSPPQGLEAIKARHANGLRHLPAVGLFQPPRSPRSPTRRPF